MNNIKSNTQNYKVELSEENQLLHRFESLIKKKHSLGIEIIEIEKEIDETKLKLRKLYRDREQENNYGKSTKRKWSR